MNKRAKVKPILPVTVGPARVPLARGVQAGRWVFASGVMATDARGGPAPEISESGRPLSGQPRWYREALCLYRRAREVLQAGGTDFSHAVRTDQYFPDWRAVPFLHQARRECCGSHVPPSTSILEPRLLLPHAGMSMDVIAVRPDTGLEITPVYPPGLDVPATSSFVPVVKVGDYVFVAGFLAAWKPGDLGGIAPEAKVPEGHLWKGNRIQLEADYIIRNKLAPALKGAGSSLANVVKAQVYLADMSDMPAFNQVWAKHFGDNVPATTFVPTLNPGFAIADARVEINLIALRDGDAAQKKVWGGKIAPACDGHPGAVQAGDLLLFSGMVATDEKGLIEAARTDARQPFFGSGVEAQMEYMLDAAEQMCAAAGTTLANVVRIQQFHTDLRDFYPAYRVWQRHLAGQPLPISAIQVPGPLPVPGCTVELDL